VRGRRKIHGKKWEVVHSERVAGISCFVGKGKVFTRWFIDVKKERGDSWTCFRRKDNSVEKNRLKRT